MKNKKALNPTKEVVTPSLRLKYDSLLENLKNQQYLSLTKELAITGFKIKYNGSFFGYLWSLMNPLFYFMILYLVFTKIFKMGGTVENYPLYLLTGVTLWSFFSEATSTCMHSILSSGDLIRKVYFPRVILPLAASITSFITLLLNLCVVFAFAIYLNVDFSFRLLYLPLYLIELYLFSLGVSFFLAALFVRFRDIGHIWTVVMQAFFYATPIIYPLAIVPKEFQKFLMASPMAHVIQNARNLIIAPTVTTSAEVLGRFWIVPHAAILITYVIGYYVFQKMAAKFAEEV